MLCNLTHFSLENILRCLAPAGAQQRYTKTYSMIVCPGGYRYFGTVQSRTGTRLVRVLDTHPYSSATPHIYWSTSFVPLSVYHCCNVVSCCDLLPVCLLPAYQIYCLTWTIDAWKTIHTCFFNNPLNSLCCLLYYLHLVPTPWQMLCWKNPGHKFPFSPHPLNQLTLTNWLAAQLNKTKSRKSHLANSLQMPNPL